MDVAVEVGEGDGDGVRYCVVVIGFVGGWVEMGGLGGISGGGEDGGRRWRWR